MQKSTLIRVCCTAIAVAALAACGDQTLTTPVSPSLRPSLSVTPSTLNVCSGVDAAKVSHATTLLGLPAPTVAAINGTNPFWGTISGSSFVISPDLFVSPTLAATVTRDKDAPQGEWSHFQASFTITGPIVGTGSLSGTANVDNRIEKILLDDGGVSLGASTGTVDDNLHSHFDGTGPVSYSTGGLTAGAHTLDFYTQNDHINLPDPTAVDYCFTVTFTPQPPPAVALFVIGDDQPHAITDIVNFWGAQWWKNNPTSKTSDNGWESFKGFAPVSTNVCGGTWSSNPGNSDPPPAAPLPSSINIIVTDKVNKNGNTLSGNIVQIITVTQDGHYDANPGHAGNGTVTAVVCPPPV